MRTNLLVLTGWFTICALCATAASAQSQIPWKTNVREAQQVASQQQRLVLLHFWDDNCPPCRRLENDVFPQPQVVRALSTNYVPVKIKVRDMPQLRRQYNVTSWPTDVITTPNGEEVFRSISSQDPDQYVALLDRVAANHQVGVPGTELAARNPSQVIQTSAQSYAGQNSGSDYRQASTPVAPERGSRFVPSSPNSYGAPASQYGADGSQYGASGSQYGAPANQYGANGNQYGASGSQYGAPANQYGANGNQYGASGSQYGAPANQYGAPAEQYGNPGPGYGAQNTVNRNGTPPPSNGGGSFAARDNAGTYGSNGPYGNSGYPGNNGGVYGADPAASGPGTDRRASNQTGYGAGNGTYGANADGIADPSNRYGADQNNYAVDQGGYGTPTGGGTPYGQRAENSRPSSQSAERPSQDTVNPYLTERMASRTPANPASPGGRPDAAGTQPPTVAQPAVALDGYCAVTLVEKQQWKKADPRWGAEHRDRIYLFAGPTEQQQFLANPDRYSPVLSGFDPVRFAETGNLVPGKRQHGVSFRNQVYLFADEATLEKFWQSPDNYAATVYRAMQQSGELGPVRR